MRIATWNLERGGRTRAARAAQALTLRRLDADIVFLTEPGPAFESGPGIVTSPRRRACRSGTESWIAILGKGLRPVSDEIPFERMAAAATAQVDGAELLLYGSVLPWGSFLHHAPELARPGEDALAAFMRVLKEQVSDLVRLKEQHPGHAVIWAGDFNQHVSGPHHGGSKAKRAALTNALASVELVVWNGDVSHAREGLHAIDLICGSPRSTVRARGRIDPVQDGITVSDHAGYWVDL